MEFLDKGFKARSTLVFTVCTMKSINSHGTDGEKCVEIVKTLHVKFFPSGSLLPNGPVDVKCTLSGVHNIMALIPI